MQLGSRRLALVAAVGLICQGTLAVSVAHATSNPGRLQQVVQQVPPALVPNFLLRAIQPTDTAINAEPSWLTRFGTRAAGLSGVFLTLTLLGFLLVAFAHPYLETVSDTVAHSFGRSFVVGMLGQVLLLPTFGMLVVGLVLSVVGALLVPFVVIVYALLAVLGIVGGFLAVAHSMGEKQTRRRMAQGLKASPNSFRYMLIGLATVLSVWLAWLVFGWVPVAGTIVWGSAVLVTWIIGTVGFGAAILSRAGVKPQFAG
ncbi:MAG: hypothetical protein SGI84_07495, partial [Gemmatimonadota bacterium]|nr:hypothetical protein [Gemmatimonadota bacterium]